MKVHTLYSLLTLFLIHYVTSQNLESLTEEQSKRKELRLKNCSWQKGECTPTKGTCGRGKMVESMEGPSCPTKTRRARCFVKCKGKKKRGKKNRGKTSPSEAGLLGTEVKEIKGTVIKPVKGAGLDASFMAKLKGCVYEKSEWGKCDPATNKMSQTLTLKKGDDTICKRKTMQQNCDGKKKRKKGKKNKKRKNKKKQKNKMAKRKKNCKYTKGEWEPCNPKTRLQSRTAELVKGNQRYCPTKKTIARRCSPKNGNKGGISLKDVKAKCETRKNPKKCMERTMKKVNKKRGCKYTRGDWEPCDAKNVKSRKLTLVPGSAAHCTKEKTKSKKCKRSKLCKYSRGLWVGCDATTRTKSRIDHLKPSSPSSCNATRNVTKLCRQRVVKPSKDCQYKMSDWGECSAVNNERNRTKTLVSGDSKVCKSEIFVTRSCVKHNGKERCFFGTYGKYKPCQNGVKTKTRPVIGGGAACQRKAAKTKPCKRGRRT